MSKARTFRTPALILKRKNFAESDRLLTLLTPSYGKISAIAKGARKPASRKTGHVELFMKSDVLIAKGRNLDILTQAEMLEPYLVIRESLERGAYANYAAELLDKFTLDDDDIGAQRLFTLLDDTFARLCTDDDPRRVIRYYELHLLNEVGFRPELERCVITQDAIQPIDQFFSFDGGGVVSPEGALHTAGLLKIDMPTLKLLRVFQRSTYEQISQLQLDETLHGNAERIMLGYLTYMLESRLQSIAFIRRIRQFTTL